MQFISLERGELFTSIDLCLFVVTIFVFDINQLSIVSLFMSKTFLLAVDIPRNSLQWIWTLNFKI